MSLKEFLEKCCWQNRTCGFCDEVEQVKMYFEIDDLFEFLWERGGKEFVDLYYTIKKLAHVDKPRMDFRQLRNFALEQIDETEHEKNADAQDFLDCVEINEEEVKKRIKELEGKE